MELIRDSIVKAAESTAFERRKQPDWFKEKEEVLNIEAH